MPWVARKLWDYIPGKQPERWDELRGDWCWIQDEEPQIYVKHGWNVSSGARNGALMDTNDTLRPAINRITRLKAARLTIEHVGAYFLLLRISPLQRRDGPAWLYDDAGDSMRFLLGLANNLSVYDHAWLCDQLFGRFEMFKRPTTVIPLNINSAREQILKWTPDCNTHGVASDWRLPTLDEELEWSSALVGKATSVVTEMYKRTSSMDVAYIMRRIE